MGRFLLAKHTFEPRQGLRYNMGFEVLRVNACNRNYFVQGSYILYVSLSSCYISCLRIAKALYVALVKYRRCDGWAEPTIVLHMTDVVFM